MAVYQPVPQPFIGGAQPYGPRDFYTPSPLGVNPNPGSLTITGYSPTVANTTSLLPPSLRIATSEWIAGCLLIGETGGGVRGQNIPATGTNGAAYTYNDLTLPGDAPKEICGRLLTLPSQGTLWAWEDTSFTFTGAPSGTYTATYQLYVDYVATGSPATITFQIGSLNLTPGTTALTLTGYAPTVARTTTGLIFPGAGSLAITAYAPTVSQSVVGLVFPDTGGLTITGQVPTVDQTLIGLIFPGVGGLTITGYSPTVLNSSPTAVSNPGSGGWLHHGGPPRKKYRAAEEPPKKTKKSAKADTDKDEALEEALRKLNLGELTEEQIFKIIADLL